MQRHFAFFIPFSAGDVSSTEAASGTDTDAKSTEVHRGLHGALHGAAEGNPALQLGGDVFSDKLSFDLGLFDFENIDFDLLATAHLTDGGIHEFNFRTLAADHQTGAGSEESDADAVPGTLDYDAGKGGKHQLPF